MKGRLCIILQKSKRKKEVKVLACFLVMMIVGGIITACSTKEKDNNSLSEISEIMLEEENTTNSSLEEQDVVPQDMVEELQSNQEESEQELGDEREIRDIVLGFAEGYFSGDIDLLKQFLTEPYEWDMDVYSGKEEVSIVEVSGIEGTKDKAIDDVQVVYLVYKENITDDSNKNLTIELVKTSQGWKIQFYGIEG